MTPACQTLTIIKCARCLRGCYRGCSVPGKDYRCTYKGSVKSHQSKTWPTARRLVEGLVSQKVLVARSGRLLRAPDSTPSIRINSARSVSRSTLPLVGCALVPVKHHACHQIAFLRLTYPISAGDSLRLAAMQWMVLACMRCNLAELAVYDLIRGSSPRRYAGRYTPDVEESPASQCACSSAAASIKCSCTSSSANAT